MRGLILYGMRIKYSRPLGFTLIELLVVMTIIASLLAIVAPRYFRNVDRSKVVALKENLAVMRAAIEKFHGDLDVYPESLEMLVEKRYLRSIPVDPVTDSAATWQIVAPADPKMGKVYDVKSGAEGRALNESSDYREW